MMIYNIYVKISYGRFFYISFDFRSLEILEGGITMKVKMYVVSLNFIPMLLSN